MSHEATNWAFQQKGLKPATKIVLIFLADRHNPDYGCFPSQQLLAQDCEMSRATLNRHLDILEDAGLIVREQRRSDATGQQQSTRYILGFEPCLKLRHGRVSKTAKPVSQNETHNLVKEEPVNTLTSVESDPLHGFDEFWDAYDHKKGRPKCEAIWKRKHLAKISNTVIDGARRYVAGDGARKKYRKYPEGWLNAERWNDEQTTGTGRYDGVVAFANQFPSSKETNHDHEGSRYGNNQNGRSLPRPE